LAIYDTNNALKDIIYFENVYPRNDELQKLMDQSKKLDKGKREVVEENKLMVVNASQLSNDPTMSLTGFYCVTLINEPKGMFEMESYFRSYRELFKKTMLISQ